MSAPLPVYDNSQLAPGAIVGGKYRIDGFLGAGGMGVVLSATHLELDAPVAIKIVREELAQHEQIVSRLLFEARAAARMRSAHVVRVLDVARLESGAPYIVMEQLQGWDLQTLLAERGVLSVPEAIRHVLQACEGLAEAHGLGIVHRDLKPENLFLATTPEGVVLKILDFGISKDVGQDFDSGHCTTLTKDGSAVGSPYYMSPEQMRASPNLDARADIWSLGAILFELLTGKCPFEADSPARLCAKVMVEEAPSLRVFSARAPERLDGIVRRCLQKDPSARFQSVTDLADELRDFVASTTRAMSEVEAVEPTPTTFTPAEPKEPPVKRKTARAWLAVAALAACAALGYWHFGNSAALGVAASPAAQQDASPKLQMAAAPQVVVASAPVAVAAPTVAVATPAVATPAVAAPAVSASTTATSVAVAPHGAAGPKFYIPPAPRQASPEAATNSPEARYGL